ncbi:hypothetical protein BC628DRAFT_384900 [Trametes gibbosa]|nr:hypothetical protein BC628DRAFT_384900 [Trametes gibbosa]
MFSLARVTPSNHLPSSRFAVDHSVPPTRTNPPDDHDTHCPRHTLSSTAHDTQSPASSTTHTLSDLATTSPAHPGKRGRTQLAAVLMLFHPEHCPPDPSLAHTLPTPRPAAAVVCRLPPCDDRRRQSTPPR